MVPSLTHEDPRAVGIQIVSQTVPNQGHGLNLVCISLVEEVGHTQTLK